jgi:Na+/H+-dicarboxylate symporter/ABC-type amino acid transport substrate-binding protein
MSLGTKILIGVLAGLAVGVFFGDIVAPLQVAGDVYVGLLQMTVLPYIFVSLVSKIGQFTYERAAQIAGRAMIVQLGLWAIVFVLIVALPFSLPKWEAGSFFSTSLIEEGTRFDFLDLYLPTNPFGAFADNIVPAAVVFSILLGVALIPIGEKGRLLEPLGVIGDAMGNIAKGVFKLSPYGTFALAGSAAGTAEPAELLRVAGYIVPFTIGVVLMTFVLLPALVASLTPIGYREVISRSRSALLTALATGKMFAVLPMVINDVRATLESHKVPEADARGTADVLVPLAYPFPNAGKFLAILFIPSAAWFIGQPLELEDYPLLLSVGLLTFFGNPVAATLFLLSLFRMPSDLLALFLIAGIWGARIGDVLGVMHLMAFSLLTTSSERGWLRLHPGKALRWLVVGVVATGASLWLNHAVVSLTVAGEPPPANRVEAMQPFFDAGAVAASEAAEPNPFRLLNEETVLQRIARTGVLRVGYEPDNPPFSYVNGEGMLVGLEVDLAHRLAVEFGVELRLVPYDIESLETDFAADHFDLAIGGLASAVSEADGYRETDPYLEMNAALVVPDHRADAFSSIAKMRQMDTLRLAYVEGGVLVRTGRHQISGVWTEAIPTESIYLEDVDSDFDALLTTAETGAIQTMIHPEFSVVIPEGFRVRVPVVVAVTPDEEFIGVVNRFMRIKRADGTIETLYDHWILGEASKGGSRRWSVIKDVLGWGE